MKCEAVEILLSDMVNKSISADQQLSMQNHIAHCSSCAQLYRQTIELFDMMDAIVVNVSKEKLDEQFQKTLYNIQQEVSIQRKMNSGRKTYTLHLRNIAAACFFILAGMAAGLLIRNGDVNKKTIASLKEELMEMKKVRALELLKETSAADRLRAVAYLQTIPSPDSTLLNILIQILNTDNSVHVRVAAASSLESFINDRLVADAMVASLVRQKAPVLQMLLIQILVEKKEESVRKSIEAIIQNANTDPEVKKMASKSIATL